MSPNLFSNPLIAIVGATGSGKSQLAVSLAERFNGEIINGDALQMYEGLPIATNKISLEERRGIPHHLLGCVKLNEEPWTVQQFRNRAGIVIEEIRSRNKLPILVGGTHYYTQSLLFKDALLEEQAVEHLDHGEQEKRWPILSASTEIMLEALRRVDPAIAQRWHPNERRKIRRSLEIWLTTGREPSEIYDQQGLMRNGSESKDPQSVCGSTDVNDADEHSDMAPHLSLHYDTLIFWTHAHFDVLNPRLEKRVDTMVSNGLLSEVEAMYKFLQDQEQQGNTVDQNRGIWVAIGFKEILPYVMDDTSLENLKKEGIERTKIATRQYAKRQVRWIKLRLQRAIATAKSSDKFFLLDASDLAQWSENVKEKARDIVEAFLNGSTLPKPQSLSDIAKEMLVVTEKEKQVAICCEACDKTLMSEGQWVRHIRSKGHKCAVRLKVDWWALYPKDNHK